MNAFITHSEIKTDLEGAGINVSNDTISRALYHTGFLSRSPRKVPLLKTKHVKDRLGFVKTYEKKNMQFWEKGIWSNGTKVELFRRNTATSVWRKNGTDFKKHNVIPTVKFGGGFIMIWGCFSSKGTGELQVINGRKNGSMYREILDKNLQKSATSLGHGQILCFHTTVILSISQNLQRNGLKIIGISTFQLNLWNTLKVKVHKRNPQNIKQLE